MRHETKSVGTLGELWGILDVVRVRGLHRAPTASSHLLLSPRSRAADIFTESFDRIATRKSENRHYQGKDEECFHDAIPILGLTPCHLLFEGEVSRNGRNGRKEGCWGNMELRNSEK